MISEGMIVRYAPDWCEEKERRCLMVVLETYPDVERCLVRHINSRLSIPPTETVTFAMIRYTGYSIRKEGGIL